MVYVACEVMARTALPTDGKTAQVAWARAHELATYVPHGLYQPVQEHLDKAMAAWPLLAPARSPHVPVNAPAARPHHEPVLHWRCTLHARAGAGYPHTGNAMLKDR
jgi:hypothetical protein